MMKYILFNIRISISFYEITFYWHSSHLLNIYLICSQEIFYFIPSSEFNAYLKQVILSAVKKYRIFSLVMNTIYIFSLAKRGCFNNVGLNFFKKRSGSVLV